MNDAIYFKWLQRKNKFRNPESIIHRSEFHKIEKYEMIDIQKYLDRLIKNNISFTYPSHVNYPKALYIMKEPPLFIEYIGEPIWMSTQLFSVVGSRKCHSLTQAWIQAELKEFISESGLTLASGGAVGVDQAAHLAALKAERPTVVVLPAGLNQIYPQNLSELKEEIIFSGGCFLTEFEIDQKVQKNFFYLRNRLIAALGHFCLVAQAGCKSGTMLTVHHALEFGRPILTIPAHPAMIDFAGNIKLIQDGAQIIHDKNELLNFWRSENWYGPVS